LLAPNPEKQVAGSLGEDLTCQYLRNQGNLHILERNWRCKFGELDIIAQDSKTKALVFIEVKSRKGDIDLAWEAFHSTKQKRLKRLALAYLKAKNLPLETAIRFDAALVDLQKREVLYEPDILLFNSEL